MSPSDEHEFAIEPVAKHHERAAFACGVAALDLYLKQRASQDARNRIAAPFVLAGVDHRVVGYYTLSSFSIALSDLPENIARKLPKYPFVPATLLGRLATDQNYRGRRLGEHLLMDALRRSFELSKEIASYAVVVDAKGGAASFYQSYEFQAFPQQPSRLFMPMKKIERLFE